MHSELSRDGLVRWRTSTEASPPSVRLRDEQPLTSGTGRTSTELTSGKQSVSLNLLPNVSVLAPKEDDPSPSSQLLASKVDRSLLRSNVAWMTCLLVVVAPLVVLLSHLLSLLFGLRELTVSRPAGMQH
jgi:hypothetical protein